MRCLPFETGMNCKTKRLYKVFIRRSIVWQLSLAVYWVRQTLNQLGRALSYDHNVWHYELELWGSTLKRLPKRTSQPRQTKRTCACPLRNQRTTRMSEDPKRLCVQSDGSRQSMSTQISLGYLADCMLKVNLCRQIEFIRTSDSETFLVKIFLAKTV